MTDAPSIVVIGSINMDLVCRTPRRPRPGETVLGHSFAAVPGGKGANQAVAAARLGAEVHLVGCVGDDRFGDDLLEGLRRDHVYTQSVRVVADESSGIASIVVDDTGENSIIVTPGANAQLTPADIDAAEPIIRHAACVLLQLEIPLSTVAHAIRRCQQWGVYTVLDPAPASDALPPELFHVDLLTPNESEARTLLGSAATGLDDLAVAVELRRRGARRVVLKRGALGAMLLESEHAPQTIPGFAVGAIDTTAAGDAFTAAMSVGLAEGRASASAVRMGNAAGALACTRSGAQPSLPSRSAVEEFQML